MKTNIINDTVDLWEAWIDLSESIEHHILYVVGTISTGASKTIPLLLKKTVQGAPASHLMLEVMPCLQQHGPREAEVHYAERIAGINQYQQISICAGEDVLACIKHIELFQ